MTNEELIIFATELQISHAGFKGIRRIQKLNRSIAAEHIRIIMLHRLTPRSQFQNDIFDFQTRYEFFFFI